MPTLMLVDDDMAVREVLREFVELCCSQYTIVAEAANGLEAVSIAQQKRPDVILMDVRMPILDGIQATRRIKEKLGKACTVITFTSYTYPELEKDSRKAGAGFHLRKPFDLDFLQKTLDEAVEA